MKYVKMFDDSVVLGFWIISHGIRNHFLELANANDCYKNKKMSMVPTWYLLVELKGISATFGCFSLISFTDPQQSSIHFRRADSEASPATSLFDEDQTISEVISN